jgi:hypothetical protein
LETGDILTDAFGRIRKLVHKTVMGLDSEAMAFRPEAEANSIAWLIWHLTRVQDDHVSEIAGREQVWAVPLWAEQLGMAADPADTGFGHSPQQVAAVRPESVEPLLGYHDAVCDSTLEYLATIDSAELDRIIDRSYDPPVSVAVRLVSVLSDDLQHIGQAAYVRGIYERRGRLGV